MASKLKFNKENSNLRFRAAKVKGGQSDGKLRLITKSSNNNNYIDICDNGNINIQGSLKIRGQDFNPVLGSLIVNKKTSLNDLSNQDISNIYWQDATGYDISKSLTNSINNFNIKLGFNINYITSVNNVDNTISFRVLRIKDNSINGIPVFIDNNIGSSVLLGIQNIYNGNYIDRLKDFTSSSPIKYKLQFKRNTDYNAIDLIRNSDKANISSLVNSFDFRNAYYQLDPIPIDGSYVIKFSDFPDVSCQLVTPSYELPQVLGTISGYEFNTYTEMSSNHFTKGGTNRKFAIELAVDIGESFATDTSLVTFKEPSSTFDSAITISINNTNLKVFNHNRDVSLSINTSINTYNHYIINSDTTTSGIEGYYNGVFISSNSFDYFLSNTDNILIEFNRIITNKTNNPRIKYLRLYNNRLTPVDISKLYQIYQNDLNGYDGFETPATTDARIRIPYGILGNSNAISNSYIFMQETYSN